MILARRFRVGRTVSGLGLFTSVALRPGARVIEYTGERISAAEADRRRGRYLFEIDAAWTVDGKDRGNLARYINHACRPNCEPRIVGRRVFIYARRAIAAGEELTYNYGRIYFAAIIAPSGCRCDACLRRARAKADRPAPPPAQARPPQAPKRRGLAGQGSG